MEEETRSIDVIVWVGETEERIERLRLAQDEQETVTVLFHIVSGSTVSLSFPAAAFVGFANRLARFARGVAGPS